MEKYIVCALIDLFSLELSAFLRVSHHKLDDKAICQIFKGFGRESIDKESFRNLFVISDHHQLEFIFKFFDCQPTEKLTIDNVIRTIGQEASQKSKTVEDFIDILKILKDQYQQIKRIWEARGFKLQTIKKVLSQIYHEFGKSVINYQDFMSLCGQLEINIGLGMQYYLQSKVFKSRSISVQDLLSDIVKYYNYSDHYSNPLIQSGQLDKSPEIDIIIRKYIDPDNQPYSYKQNYKTKAEQIPHHLVLPNNNFLPSLRYKDDHGYENLTAEYGLSKPNISHQDIIQTTNNPYDSINHIPKRHELNTEGCRTFSCFPIPLKQSAIADIIKKSNQNIKKIQRKALENAYRKMGYLL